ncbi:MAG TPA: carbohydrate ABC transporter substrate-binding protein, partial [Halococcus sp.]|nr:carbohydrate ABC transporter substrate-binding protein [Halococcus sp.]
IGWHGGDGDIMALPTPKVDPDYGKKVGISDLEGVKGEHGGQVWAFEQLHAVYNVDKKEQQKAWDLLHFMLTDKDFVLPAWGKYYGATPGYQPLLDDLKQKYDLSQLINQELGLINEYGDQYQSTGASWDVTSTSQLRWQALNNTISKGLAGQIPAEKVPSEVRKNMLNTLKK